MKTYEFSFTGKQIGPTETCDQIMWAANGFLRAGSERKYAQDQATKQRLVEFAQVHPDIELVDFNRLAACFGYVFNMLPVVKSWNVKVDFSSITQINNKSKKNSRPTNNKRGR